MKLFLLALLVAAAAAMPLDEDVGDVELIVNGVAEGEPLEIGDVLGLKVKEHIDGQVASSTDLLHPLTAVGLAEAAAAAESSPVDDWESDFIAVNPVEVPSPEPVVLPSPVLPEFVPESVSLPEAVLPVIVPESVSLPEPALPEVVPEAVVLPEPVLPEVILNPVILPDPAVPEVVPEPVVIPEPMPEPVPQNPTGEVFNDGVVQVTVNAEPSVMTTVQSWFNMVLNYFNGDVQTTHQIV